MHIVCFWVSIDDLAVLLPSHGHYISCTLKDIVPVVLSFLSLCYRQVSVLHKIMSTSIQTAMITFIWNIYFISSWTCSITSCSDPTFLMIFLVAKYRGDSCICSLWFLVFHLLLTCPTQALPLLFHAKKWLLLRLTKISMLLNPVVNFWFSFCLAHWQHLTQFLLASSLTTFLSTFLA